MVFTGGAGLAARLNKRVNEVALSVGRADDQKLLMLTALTMEGFIEELEESQKSSVSGEVNSTASGHADRVAEKMLVAVELRCAPSPTTQV